LPRESFTSEFTKYIDLKTFSKANMEEFLALLASRVTKDGIDLDSMGKSLRCIKDDQKEIRDNMMTKSNLRWGVLILGGIMAIIGGAVGLIVTLSGGVK
jgi:hypothetical protein